MVELKTGMKAPQFCLMDFNNNKICLKKLEGNWIVLYFYPKDNTSGCTIEAQEFTGLHEEFKKNECLVIGISPDNCASHQKFVEKYELTIQLLSDPEKKVLTEYGVWREKSMYGKKYMGVLRSTALINPTGNIEKIYYGVSAKGHAKEILDELKTLRTKN